MPPPVRSSFLSDESASEDDRASSKEFNVASGVPGSRRVLRAPKKKNSPASNSSRLNLGTHNGRCRAHDEHRTKGLAASCRFRPFSPESSLVLGNELSDALDRRDDECSHVTGPRLDASFENVSSEWISVSELGSGLASPLPEGIADGADINDSPMLDQKGGVRSYLSSDLLETEGRTASDSSLFGDLTHRRTSSCSLFGDHNQGCVSESAAHVDHTGHDECGDGRPRSPSFCSKHDSIFSEQNSLDDTGHAGRMDYNHGNEASEGECMLLREELNPSVCVWTRDDGGHQQSQLQVSFSGLSDCDASPEPCSEPMGMSPSAGSWKREISFSEEEPGDNHNSVGASHSVLEAEESPTCQKACFKSSLTSFLPNSPDADGGLHAQAALPITSSSRKPVDEDLANHDMEELPCTSSDILPDNSGKLDDNSTPLFDGGCVFPGPAFSRSLSMPNDKIIEAALGQANLCTNDNADRKGFDISKDGILNSPPEPGSKRTDGSLMRQSFDISADSFLSAPVDQVTADFGRALQSSQGEKGTAEFRSSFSESKAVECSANHGREEPDNAEHASNNGVLPHGRISDRHPPDAQGTCTTNSSAAHFIVSPALPDELASAAAKDAKGRSQAEAWLADAGEEDACSANAAHNAGDSPRLESKVPGASKLRAPGWASRQCQDSRISHAAQRDVDHSGYGSLTEPELKEATVDSHEFAVVAGPPVFGSRHLQELPDTGASRDESSSGVALLECGEVLETNSGTCQEENDHGTHTSNYNHGGVPCGDDSGSFVLQSSAGGAEEHPSPGAAIAPSDDICDFRGQQFEEQRASLKAHMLSAGDIRSPGCTGAAVVEGDELCDARQGFGDQKQTNRSAGVALAANDGKMQGSSSVSGMRDSATAASAEHDELYAAGHMVDREEHLYGRKGSLSSRKPMLLPPSAHPDEMQYRDVVLELRAVQQESQNLRLQLFAAQRHPSLKGSAPSSPGVPSRSGNFPPSPDGSRTCADVAESAVDARRPSHIQRLELQLAAERQDCLNLRAQLQSIQQMSADKASPSSDGRDAQTKGLLELQADGIRANHPEQLPKCHPVSNELVAGKQIAEVDEHGPISWTPSLGVKLLQGPDNDRRQVAVSAASSPGTIVHRSTTCRSDEVQHRSQLLQPLGTASDSSVAALIGLRDHAHALQKTLDRLEAETPEAVQETWRYIQMLKAVNKQWSDLCGMPCLQSLCADASTPVTSDGKFPSATCRFSLADIKSQAGHAEVHARRLAARVQILTGP